MDYEEVAQVERGIFLNWIRRRATIAKGTQVHEIFSYLINVMDQVLDLSEYLTNKIIRGSRSIKRVGSEGF